MTTRIIPLAVLVASWTLAGCEDLTPFLQGAAEGLRQAGVQPLGATPVSGHYPAPSSYSQTPQFHGSSGYSPPSQASQPQFDRGLNHCVSFGRDSNDYYFQNNCSVPVSISYQCTDASTGQPEAPAGIEVAPGARGDAPCYLARSNTDYAVCPLHDGFFAADGKGIWIPNHPFTCRRMQ